MHLNYHFFRHLVPQLRTKLLGKVLLQCFSQEKDELVMGFGSKEEDVYLRISVLSAFSGLYLTNDFKRARKNSVDLFGDFLDRTVVDVLLFENERAIEIQLKDGYSVILKMFGNRSNVLGAINNQVITLFNNRLPEDKEIIPSNLHRTLDQSEKAFLSSNLSVKQLFPTWGKIPLQVYEQSKTGDSEKDWELCNSINRQLESGHFYLTTLQGKLQLSLLHVGEVKEVFTDVLEANNRFFIENLKSAQLNNEQSLAVKQLQKRIQQTKTYIRQTQETLEKLIEGIGNQNLGHILMANLHAIPDNSESVVLPDFQTGAPVTIKLKKSLSPQKNAEAYYRKAKNEKLQFDFLEKNIAEKEKLLASLENQLKEAEAAESLKELRSFVKSEMPAPSKKQAPVPEELFKIYEKGNYRIWVGRNAKNNDLLTLKYTDKNDTWLHARDVAGSHVVIKQIPGSKIPKDVLEYAAQLAAWYSKRRTDSLVPVAYTLKKYVRKVKGTPDGQVMVDKEDVILVKPQAVN